MLKRLLLLSASAFFCLTASAQFRYTFKDTTTAYTPLTASATSVNGSTIWYGDDYTAPVPFTWKMDSTISLNSIDIMTSFPAVVDNSANTSNLNGFMLGLTEIADRGNLSATASLSPIRYATTGSSPNRIFKLEFFNAGFGAEMYQYTTMNDSFNLQMWIYETSNIVELHFGPSRISYPSDYFPASGPILGYMKNVDFDNGTQGMLYYVKGTASATGIDSAAITAPTPPTNILSAWPADGKVFRFTPRKQGCTPPATPIFTAGPDINKTVQFTYTGSTSGLDSLVWNFGDGLTQKVITGLNTPVSHTYAIRGRYSVTVTAYNSCGNTISTARQTTVSVQSVAALGNVQVYPNPATNMLMIDGMEAGSTAVVYAVTGQAVLHADLKGTMARVDVSTLPAGTYTIVLSGTDGKTGAMQFVKQ